MKKILSILLLIIASTTHSQPISVWLTHPSGQLDTMCRKIWRDYTEIYREDAIILSQPGADGIIATRSVLMSSDERRVLCHGGSIWVQNRFVHNNVNLQLDKLVLLAKYSDEPTVWYVPKNNHSRTLDELIAKLRNLNRPINIGVFTGAHRALGLYVEQRYNLPVNLISYKKGTDFYSQLADATLDLAFDAGTAVEVARTGMFNIAGYSSLTNEENLSEYKNFSIDNPEFGKFSIWLGISVPADTSTHFQQQLLSRIEHIVTRPQFKQFAKTNFCPVNLVKLPEVDRFVQDQVTATSKIWKRIQ